MYKTLKKHVHTRVLVQLFMFAVVSIGLLIALVHDELIGYISIGLSVIGLLFGAIVGYFVGKIFKLSWKEEVQKVVMSLDRMGFLLIGVYVLFRIFGEQLLGTFVKGEALSALTFAFLAGLLIGRFASIWQGVRRILKQQGII